MPKPDENGVLRLRKRELIGIIFIAGGFFALTNFRMNTLAEDSKECKTKNELQEKAITTVQNDIQHIRGDLDGIHREQTTMNNKIDEGNKILYKILGKLEADDEALIRGTSYAGERPIIRGD